MCRAMLIAGAHEEVGPEPVLDDERRRAVLHFQHGRVLADAAAQAHERVGEAEYELARMELGGVAQADRLLDLLLISCRRTWLSGPDAPGWYHPGRSGTIKMGPKVVLARFGDPRILAMFAASTESSSMMLPYENCSALMPVSSGLGASSAPAPALLNK